MSVLSFDLLTPDSSHVFHYLLIISSNFLLFILSYFFKSAVQKEARLSIHLHVHT